MQLTVVTRQAMAAERIVLIHTSAAIVAFIGFAFIDVNFAVGSRESGHARAGILADFVPTSAEITARIAGTFVDVDVAVLSRPAFEALAFVR